jgi:hypothetical protein
MMSSLYVTRSYPVLTSRFGLPGRRTRHVLARHDGDCGSHMAYWRLQVQMQMQMRELRHHCRYLLLVAAE